jgi:hypothetical protein
VFRFLAFEGRDAPMIMIASGEWLTFNDESLAAIGACLRKLAHKVAGEVKDAGRDLMDD